jgi:hypothetical protein
MEPYTALIGEYLYLFPEKLGTKKFSLPIFHTHSHSQTIMCGLAKNPCLPAGNLDLELRKLLYYPLYYVAGGAKVIFRR